MSLYADKDYYQNTYKGSSLSSDNELNKYLQEATDDVNSLTFNRIVGKGFDNLTNFQKDIIQRVCCQFAEFKFENADVIESILSSYSINGVSQSFGNNNLNVKVIEGIAIPFRLYKLLGQTGLTCKNVRYYQ